VKVAFSQQRLDREAGAQQLECVQAEPAGLILEGQLRET
jgi:hypothetical protein